MRKKTQKQHIADFNATHNFRYDYSKVEYIDSRTKVTIICKLHGEFTQTPANHKFGQNCPTCGIIASNKNSTKSQSSWVTRAVATHKNKYDYSNSVYLGADKQIEIKCKIHGIFSQRALSHLKGHGCKKCAVENKLKVATLGKTSGFIFFLNKPTKLYYVKIETPQGYLYKIGITTKAVKERFRPRNGKPPIKYTLLALRVYPTGSMAFKREQEIIRKFAEYTYDGLDVLHKGNTELFTKDVLNGKL